MLKQNNSNSKRVSSNKELALLLLQRVEVNKIFDDYEHGLPKYLQHDLDAYKEGLEHDLDLMDCLWGELYGSINAAQINDRAFTPEHADYLRRKYLYSPKRINTGEGNMKTIELERWEPKPDDPCCVHFVGLRTGQEVFNELKERLEQMGLLPDEYVSLDIRWEHGEEIPKGADVFCTCDYGSSEGIYLDVYLKWYEEGKPVVEGFATGKTLDDSGVSLDRMFLVAAAVTKAFHGYGYDLGNSGCILHLSHEEAQMLTDILTKQKEALPEQMQTLLGKLTPEAMQEQTPTVKMGDMCP